MLVHSQSPEEIKAAGDASVRKAKWAGLLMVGAATATAGILGTANKPAEESLKSATPAAKSEIFEGYPTKSVTAQPGQGELDIVEAANPGVILESEKLTQSLVQEVERQNDDHLVQPGEQFEVPVVAGPKK